MSPYNSSGWTIIYIAAILANLYYWAATQAMQIYFHVFGVVLVFLAASIAWEYSFNWTKQDAIFELFLTIV